jgi:hypothetical protein
MKILKNFRLFVFIFLLVISLYFLFSFLIEKGGVIVKSLHPANKCNNLVEEVVITSVNNVEIHDLKDFEEAIKKVKAGDYVSIIANNIPAGCFAINDSDLGIEVEEVTRGGLKFSDEIVDSKVDVFKVENASIAEVKKVYEILENRLKKLKIPRTKILLSDSSIKIVNFKNLENLFARCKFEIKISHQFDVENGSALISIGENAYEIKFFNGSFEINNRTHFLNETFYLEGIKFELLNVTNASGIFHATLVSNEDITNVLSNLGFIRYDEASKNFIFYLPLNISEKAEENVKKILKNIGTFFLGNQVFLQANFLYFLDGKLLSQMPVSREFRVRASPIPVIIFEKTFDGINDIKKCLDSCLSSGILEYKLEKVRTEIQKAKFTNLAKILFLVSMSIAFIPTFKFYKKFKSVHSVLFSIFLILEIFVILGIAGLTEFAFSPGWVIDLATIFGILTLTSFNVASTFLEIKGVKEYLFLASGFIFLFTPINGLGLSILFGMIIHKLLVRPILKDFT